ncbi:N-6 DNA methylase [Mucilaginibacter sp.]|uniref:HsdM family class I SAM-dependent methyltransferase n=1 Tax=Mucilaginibacter sp. TaxID=1882438 RepID=UPI00260B87EC|nr:N-6 DNA methylase [Mucilaginibacter sp.]MDB5032679.1 hypothetical protein [Mucilaginibacter sp.]
MPRNNFYNYLNTLGYTQSEISSGSIDDSTFVYATDSKKQLPVKYILTLTKQDVYNAHKLLWNKSEDNVFLAVSDHKTYLINVNDKPDINQPLKKSTCLKTFDYGINSLGFENVIPSEITKTNIDSAYFFNFISTFKKRGQQVDKDLLLNLLALKNNLAGAGNEDIIHLLILRCLFIKYLEDRGIFEKHYLLNILKSGVPGNLSAAFDEIKKINGDVFKYDEFQLDSILPKFLTELALFFESDYRSGQQYLFPYQFDQIPIQLISHVYEAFLKEDNKKSKGIYYTPPFLVRFMLSQTLEANADLSSNLTVLDPAVGSGAFLVESFRIIQRSHKGPLSFEDKKRILEHQLFGIDVDRKALQIAAFSLYLALLETEDPVFIRDEIKHAHPILPSLIGKTLIHGNAITDKLFSAQTFDYIVSNPPWGSVPVTTEDLEGENGENRKEREAIDNIEQDYPEYKNVANYERSQAFLIGVNRWCNPLTEVVMVVKNSIFLTDNALDFRRELLTKYKIDTFYELSHLNKILFKKTEIGYIGDQKIELGASEPCAVLVFSPFSDKNSDPNMFYVSPKLTPFAENFDLIQFTSRDKFEIHQTEFIKHDLLWKVLVDGEYEDFELISKLRNESTNENIICSRGFEPSKNMVATSEVPHNRTLIKSEDFDRYKIKKRLGVFNWNQTLRRRTENELFNHDRILIAYRPGRKDNFRLRCIKVIEDMVFRNDVLCFKYKGVTDHTPYLALLNSSLFGYFIYNISSQWDGGLKREALRTYDIKAFNYDLILTNSLKANLSKLIGKINTADSEVDVRNLDAHINSYLLSNSNLLDYEKEIINEFYQIRVERANNSRSVANHKDIENYIANFKKTFSLILSDAHTLNFSYHISSNFGAIISASIVPVNKVSTIAVDENLKILNFVKSKQMQNADALNVLNEGKVKLYEENKIYIIKSNQFKDWTVRQAIKDAREEVSQFIKQLKD